MNGRSTSANRRIRRVGIGTAASGIVHVRTRRQVTISAAVDPNWHDRCSTFDGPAQGASLVHRTVHESDTAGTSSRTRTHLPEPGTVAWLVPCTIHLAEEAVDPAVRNRPGR
jgi:hypothetical protein